MVRRSMKTEFSSPDPVTIAQDDILHVPGSSDQHSPSPGETPNGLDVEMLHITDSRRTDSANVKGRLPSAL